MGKEGTETNTLPFILVSDKIIIDLLKNRGFECINETDKMCTFINNGKLVFDGGIDEHKVMYSNKLCI